MKRISFIILMVLAGSAALMTNTGCSGDGSPTPKDTTDQDTTTPGIIRQGFDLGVKKYKLHIEDVAEAVYSVNNNQTYFTFRGQDTTDKIVDKRPIYVTFEVDSNVAGVYSSVGGQAAMEITLGTGLPQQTWISAGGNVTINVTEYGEVGGRIKGTFSGTFKWGTNSTTVKSGFFDVKRLPDA